ncbi:C-GCAxxG-C-C family protein [Candidatus Soleaferrea massiliensis]|uniref:C-GCAxxG-C-C family protein n=1 Tax=Candidatus Soleaferrea massiliensis TaxID=1470354 RepID=UPI00058D3BC9|nr:C-GCAxxG-C-C family protein [Candidatus Soleaferrea massiliensis]
MKESRVGIAAQKHQNGYNCCQAVVCAYSDLLGMDEQTAFRASEGFGLGVAGMYETCGSVCAMVLLAGLQNSDGNLEKPATKLSTFELGRRMSDKFTEMNTTIVCKTLRGTDGVTDRLRSCRGCVIDCARIVEDTLFPGEFAAYDGPNE